jgi:hypothetical protein
VGQLTTQDNVSGLNPSVRYGDTLSFTYDGALPDGGYASIYVSDPEVTYNTATGRFTFTPNAGEVGHTRAIPLNGTVGSANWNDVLRVDVGQGLVARPATGNAFRYAAPLALYEATLGTQPHRFVLVPANATLDLYEVTGDQTPVRVSQVRLAGDAVAVTTLYHYALVADAHYGLGIVDLADPFDPVVVEQLHGTDPGDVATAVAADPATGRVALASRWGAVQIFDLAGLQAGPQAALSVAPTYAFPDDPTGQGLYFSAVTFQHGAVFVADSLQGLLFGIDPATGNTLSVQTLQGDGVSGPPYVSALLAFSSAGHDHVVAVDSWEEFLEVFDVTAPASPVAFTPSHPVPIVDFEGAAMVGTRLFLADIYNSALVSLDLADPANPAVDAAGQFSELPSFFGVVGSSDGTRLYTASGQVGLETWAYQAGSASTRLNQGPAGQGFLVEVSSGNLLVRAGQTGVAFLDATTGQPQGSLPLSVSAAAVSGGTVAVVSGGAVQLIDASDPAAPALGGSLTLPGPAGQVRLAAIPGRPVFVALTRAPNGSIAVIDASDPAAPVVASTLAVQIFDGVSTRAPDSATPQVAVSDGRDLYLNARIQDATSGQVGGYLFAFDLQNPSAPVFVAQGPPTAQALDAAYDATHRRVFLATNGGLAGVLAVDVPSPAAMTAGESLRDQTFLYDPGVAVALSANHLLLGTTRGLYAVGLDAAGHLGAVEAVDHHGLLDQLENFPNDTGSLWVNGDAFDAVRSGGIDRYMICGGPPCVP